MTIHPLLFWASLCLLLTASYAVGYIRGERLAWERRHREDQHLALRVVRHADLMEVVGPRAEQLRQKAWWN